jgi:hypothetical protein
MHQPLSVSFRFPQHRLSLFIYFLIPKHLPFLVSFLVPHSSALAHPYLFFIPISPTLNQPLWFHSIFFSMDSPSFLSFQNPQHLSFIPNFSLALFVDIPISVHFSSASMYPSFIIFLGFIPHS